MLYSIIIPVYNRPDEVTELLESLSRQEGGVLFEVVVVEDGSTQPCRSVVERYTSQMNVVYHAKPNTGRSDTRNYGIKHARGDYFIFFDSDCLIPPHYLVRLNRHLTAHYFDCFGGPDAAHESFTRVQKAINYAMTSPLTTGGIRGGKQAMEKFKPRTFNMGFSRKVYERVGGFNDMFGEDIDLSLRIAGAGFSTSLFLDTFVYHKRRVDFKKFFKQIYHFGVARINLALLHKGSLRWVHTFPAFFLVGGAGVVALSVAHSPGWLLLPAFYTALLFVDAALRTRNGTTALLAVGAAYTQLTAYGLGFLGAFVRKIILRQGLEDQATLKRLYS
jgi:glycosyltransferase involved in cell wall biosynthesis